MDEKELLKEKFKSAISSAVKVISEKIDFTLKLFAGTYPELQSISQKMNRLTSMCYPEYKDDTTNFSTAKTRMKPPLMKLRLGDLYGRSKFVKGDPNTSTEDRFLTTDMTGFIKSLSSINF